MTKTLVRYKGGKGSGHHGHKGRPGKHGGSLPGEGGGGKKEELVVSSGKLTESPEFYEEAEKPKEEEKKTPPKSKFSGHRKMANTIKSKFAAGKRFGGNVFSERGRGMYQSTVNRIKIEKKGAIESWLGDNGFTSYDDPYKSEYFKKNLKGTSWTDGTFKVTVSRSVSPGGEATVIINHIEKGKIKIDYSKIPYYD